MDKAAVLETIERFRQCLVNRGIAVSRIQLYGSFAGGVPHPGSDIDLVVVSQDFETMDYWQRIDVLARAIAEVWEPIEAVAMTPEEWQKGDSMIAQFAREGEAVYAAE